MTLKLRDFKIHGYNVHGPGLEKNWAWKLIQKRFQDEKGNTKYFINVYVSDFRLWDFCPNDRFLKENPRSYTIKVQLYRRDYTFNISISHDKSFFSVKEIEDLVEEIYIKMNMDFDNHNQ